MSPKTLRRRASQCREFELEVEALAMEEAADEIERLWDALMEIRTMQGNPIEIARKATDNYEPPDPPGWEGGFAENH